MVKVVLKWLILLVVSVYVIITHVSKVSLSVNITVAETDTALRIYVGTYNY